MPNTAHSVDELPELTRTLIWLKEPGRSSRGASARSDDKGGIVVVLVGSGDFIDVLIGCTVMPAVGARLAGLLYAIVGGRRQGADGRAARHGLAVAGAPGRALRCLGG